MSSRFTLRYLPVIALLAMVVAGCVEPLRPLDPRSDGASYLPIAVYVPSAPATKASGGLVASKTAESTLYDLEIWAFTHQAPGETKYDDEGAVAYLCLPSISASAFDDKGELDVSLRIPDYVMSRPDSLMRFDFYFQPTAVPWASTCPARRRPSCRAVPSSARSSATATAAVSGAVS